MTSLFGLTVSLKLLVWMISLDHGKVHQKMKILVLSKAMRLTLFNGKTGKSLFLYLQWKSMGFIRRFWTPLTFTVWTTRWKILQNINFCGLQKVYNNTRGEKWWPFPFVFHIFITCTDGKASKLLPILRKPSDSASPKRSLKFEQVTLTLRLFIQLTLLVAVALEPSTTGTFVTWTERYRLWMSGQAPSTLHVWNSSLKVRKWGSPNSPQCPYFFCWAAGPEASTLLS